MKDEGCSKSESEKQQEESCNTKSATRLRQKDTKVYEIDKLFYKKKNQRKIVLFRFRFRWRWWW